MESRQPFDEIKHRHTLKEVGDVAKGRDDWKIKNGQKVGSILMKTKLNATTQSLYTVYLFEGRTKPITPILQFADNRQ